MKFTASDSRQRPGGATGVDQGALLSCRRDVTGTASGSPHSPFPACRMRLLITGANGFLARALQPQLPPAWSIVGLARWARGADVYPLTYRDAAQLLRSEAPFDGVMHFAAQIRDPGTGPACYLPANVDLCSTLVQALPHARHVLASSVSVFGPSDGSPVTMATPCRPTHPYGLSKLAGECVVGTAPSHAILRFSSLLGRGMHPDTFVPRIIADARRDGQITLMGSGERLQNYLDVRDAAALCLRVLDMAGNVATLGIGPRSWSNREIAGHVAKRLGSRIVLAGSDDSPSSIYLRTDGIELGENARPMDETMDWLVEQ